MKATCHIGFAARYATRLVDSRERASHVASLLVDPRWPWPPASLTTGEVAELTKRTRTQRVAGASGQKRILERILDPVTRIVQLSRHSQAEQYCQAWIETGTFTLSGWEQPFKASGHTRVHDLHAGRTINEWIPLVHELMVTLDVASAILPLYETANAVLADVLLMSIVLDSRWIGRADLGPGEAFAEQNDHANYWRDLLGATYVRNARWGTYLRMHHIDTVGGIDRIRREVEPARIDQLGELVYFQLTERGLASSGIPGRFDSSRSRRRRQQVLRSPMPSPKSSVTVIASRTAIRVQRRSQR